MNKITRLTTKEKPTTGCKEVDRNIEDAVHLAILRLTPIIRQVICEELKRVLEVEPDKPTP